MCTSYKPFFKGLVEGPYVPTYLIHLVFHLMKINLYMACFHGYEIALKSDNVFYIGPAGSWSLQVGYKTLEKWNFRESVEQFSMGIETIQFLRSGCIRSCFLALSVQLFDYLKGCVNIQEFEVKLILARLN